MKNQLNDLLLSVAGQKLSGIYALVYSYKDNKDFINPQELELQFVSCLGGSIKLICNPDGSSIGWLAESITPSDLGEFGKQTVEDISQNQKCIKIINKTLSSVNLIQSSVEKCVIGVQFIFDEMNYVSILNLGDELFIFNEIPQSILDEQGIKLCKLGPVFK